MANNDFNKLGFPQSTIVALAVAEAHRKQDRKTFWFWDANTNHGWRAELGKAKIPAQKKPMEKP